MKKDIFKLKPNLLEFARLKKNEEDEMDEDGD